MIDRHIAITPVDGGWSVACGSGMEPVLFLSGARAEAQARTLARRLSEAGEDVRVTVHDRSRALVGYLHFPAAWAFRESAISP